ncbi:MAG: hypothetical protein R8G66_00745 [Cytophagales bacterium]|nr:hypothetical protein [Cytophagales bacterium]
MTKKKLPKDFRILILFNGEWGFGPPILFIFGIVLSINYISTFDLDSFRYLRDDLAIGEGKIINIFDTSIGDENPVFGYDYVFFSPAGEFSWTSYSSKFNYKVGDKVKVEYNAQRPYVHRIQGMSNTLGSSFSLWLFLSVSIGWFLYNTITGLKKLRIIRNGIMIQGNLFNKKSVNAVLTQFSYAFTASDKKKYKVHTRTFEPKKIKDEKHASILYLETDPQQALVVDTLPGLSGKVIKEIWID